jgi:hypothetical protein
VKRAETGPIEHWSHGGGDLAAAGRALVASGRLGAYLEIAVEPLGTFVADGLVDDVWACWQALIARLPADAVAKREAWFMIGAVLSGDPVALVDLAKELLAIMKQRPRTPPYRVAILLVELDAADPEAAFAADLAGELQDLDGDCVGWVTAKRIRPGKPEVSASVDWVVGGD